MATLHFVFHLVVNAARRTAVFVGQALLDPITVEAKLIQQRRTRFPQVVYIYQRVTSVYRRLWDTLGRAKIIP
jgi:hypothetical protein